MATFKTIEYLGDSTIADTQLVGYIGGTFNKIQVNRWIFPFLHGKLNGVIIEFAVPADSNQVHRLETLINYVAQDYGPGVSTFDSVVAWRTKLHLSEQQIYERCMQFEPMIGCTWKQTVHGSTYAFTVYISQAGGLGVLHYDVSSPLELFHPKKSDNNQGFKALPDPSPQIPQL